MSHDPRDGGGGPGDGGGCDVPSMTPINDSHAKLAWMVTRNQFDALAALKWKNSLDVLDLFFGFDPRTRSTRKGS